MEQIDRDLILALCPTNSKLKKLYTKHKQLEKEVEKFERYLCYSATAELKQKQLKKEKLKGVDDMMAIISQHRREKQKLVEDSY